MKRAATVILLAIAASACSGGPMSEPLDAAAAAGARSGGVRTLAGTSFFFGHQSVGYDIVEGVAELAAETGSSVRVLETRNPADVNPGVFAHATVGRNGDPLSKIQAFAEAMDAGIGGRADAAMLKFCYIDVDASTDVEAIFAAYRRTISSLRERYPATRIVHITMPLRLVQSGPKALVKRALGRAPGGYADNIRRNAYNELLRREYAGREPLFDLAAVESTLPDGDRVTFRWEGQDFSALNPALTPDNGHLNAVGRRLVAGHFVEALGAAGRGSAQ